MGENADERLEYRNRRKSISFPLRSGKWEEGGGEVSKVRSEDKCVNAPERRETTEKPEGGGSQGGTEDFSKGSPPFSTEILATENRRGSAWNDLIKRTQHMRAQGA